MSDHHGIALAQGIDKPIKLREIVAVVGVRHDHESAAGGLDAALQRGAVPSDGDVDDPSAQAPRNALGAVRAPVVRDDHLAVDPHAGNGRLGLPNADLQRFGLVRDRTSRVDCFVRYLDGRAQVVEIRAVRAESMAATDLRAALLQEFPALPIRVKLQ